MSKRTVIKADEELVIKGKLTVEGNVTQIETTEIVNRLESNSLIINSDGENVTAELTLNSDGTLATMSFNEGDGAIKFNQPLDLGSYDIVTTGNIEGSYIIGNGSTLTGLTTSIVAEGINLYYTTGRVNSAIDAYVIGGAGLTYSSGTFAVGAGTGITVNADDVQINAAYVTGLFSVTDSGGDGSLSYNSSTGVFTYTGPSASEVRAHLSATNGVEYSNSTGVINLASSTAGNGLTYTTGVLAVGAGDGITVNADNVAVNNTVIRTTGDQTITGNTTFVGTTNVTGNIVPTAANTYNLGSWENHFDYVFANVIHVEYLDLQDANISDIHARFFAGNVPGPYLNTNTAGGLIYTHNATAAGYQVNPGDGLQLVSNAVAVDGTVVRTTGDQTITGNIGINGTLTVAGTINSQNVEDTFVKDTKITLNSNAAVDNSVNIEVNRPVAGANTYIKWDENTDQWKFTNNGTTEYPLPTSTTDLNEGNNLYFTTGRVNTAIDAYVIGGAGLTYSSGTLAVGAGTGITVNADDVAVNADYVKNLISASNGVSYNSSTGALSADSSVVRTTGDQSIGGIKNFTGELIIPSALPTSNNTIYVNAGNTAVYAYVNGQHVQLTADSDIGQVEDVGTTGIDIYAGSRSVVLGNNTIYYHGIRSIAAGSYLDISEASNVITVAGNATGIRGLISASGNISYDSANGIISENLTTTDIDEGNNLYFTAARVRGNISGTGLITYNSNTGVISTTADNYSNWDVQTDSGVGSKHSVASNSTVIVSGGTGITVTNTGGNITIASTNSADIEAVSAGSGLTGGGTSGAVTLNVGAGDGITVNADNVALSTSGVASGTYGNAGAVSQLVIDSFGRTTSATNVSISITANQVSDFTSAANTAIDARVSGGAGLTYTSGVLAVGAGTGITVNADDVAVNVTYIRNQFSATGPLSYDSANGVFSIAEVGDISEVVAGSGLTGGGSSGSVTLNIGAGAGITVNADNVALTSGVITTGANTYGTASQVPAITVDTYGRVTSASNTTISITASQVSDFTSSVNTAIDSRIIGGSGLTYSGGTLAVGAGNYIQVGADDISVDATSTNTANKVVVRDSSGNFAANIITATATSARYADLAENYLADADYLPGTVLVFGGDTEVTAATTPTSTRIAGVVTTQPAHVMNSHLDGPHVACIALRGRVPVKVMGVVRKGDVLVSAGEGHIGYAVAALYPRDVPAAAMVGKAIGDKLDAGPGVVEALI